MEVMGKQILLVAVLMMPGLASAGTAIDYRFDPEMLKGAATHLEAIQKLGETYLPTGGLCHPDKVYAALLKIGFGNPVDISVRGMDIRVPWAAERSPYVGSFGPTRNSGHTFHGGTDLLGLNTDSIRAVADGYASVVKNSSGKFGSYVLQTVQVPVVPRRSPCLVVVLYGHLSDISIKSGPIKVGETIGTMGRTGYSQDKNKSIPTHLHIELWVRESYLQGITMRKIFTRDILPLILPKTTFTDLPLVERQ